MTGQGAWPLFGLVAIFLMWRWFGDEASRARAQREQEQNRRPQARSGGDDEGGRFHTPEPAPMGFGSLEEHLAREREERELWEEEQVAALRAEREEYVASLDAHEY